MSDRIAVMNRGRVEQVGESRGRLRATRHDLRRRLHRRLQPDARHRYGAPGEVQLDHRAQAVKARTQTGSPPASTASPSCARRSCKSNRSIPGGAPSANGALPRVEGVVESSVYLGTATQIVVDPLGEAVRMTVLLPQRRASRSAQRLPGGGRTGGAELGARAHAPGVRVRRGGPRQPRSEGDAMMRDQSWEHRDRRWLHSRRSRDRRVWRRRRCGRRQRRRSPGRAGRGGERRGPDLELARIRRPGLRRHHRPVRRADRRQHRVQGGRQRQRRLLQQAEAAARSGRAPAAAASSSSPTGWRSGCTTSATCRSSTTTTCRRCSTTSSRSSRSRRTTPSASSRSRGRVVRPGSSSTPTRPRRSTRSRTCSTRSTRAR